jgi:hypothetical protein
MTAIYLIGAFVTGGLLFVNRNKTINNILIVLYGILQWGFTVYACFHLKKTEIDYFTIDSLGLLLLLTLSIVSIPAFIHSYI